MRPGPAALGAAGLAVAGLAIRALWLEPRSLALRREDVAVPGWQHDGLRVAVISDLHTGAPHTGLDRVERIVELLWAERPDLVALLGDYVDQHVALGTDVAPEAVARRLARLWAPLGAVAVLGNHDWIEGGERVRAALRDEGIRVLENDSLQLSNGQWVLGLADASTRVPDVAGTYEDLPADAVPLVLSHDPDLFPTLPDRPQLVLSGHTHGGQVDLPGIREPWVPSRFGDRYTGGGVVRSGHRRLYVSRGVGTSRLPVRLRARPEVAVLTVRRG
jgi:predicted MPP superfamily phosphohydrolase